MTRHDGVATVETSHKRQADEVDSLRELLQRETEQQARAEQQLARLRALRDDALRERLDDHEERLERLEASAKRSKPS